LGEFLRRKRAAGQPIVTARRLPRQLRGTIVEFRFTLKGFRGKAVRSRWSLYNAGRHTQERTAPQASPIKVDADTDRFSDFTWIQDPRDTGLWYAKIELYDEHGTLLDSGESKKFRVD
jgi:hypothetical protein